MIWNWKCSLPSAENETVNIPGLKITEVTVSSNQEGSKQWTRRLSAWLTAVSTYRQRDIQRRKKKKAVVKRTAEIISKKQSRTTNYYLKWKENV